MHGNDRHLDGLFKSLNFPKHIVESNMHALEIGPYRTCVAPQETCKEDREKDIFVRAAYALQECQFGASV